MTTIPTIPYGRIADSTETFAGCSSMRGNFSADLSSTTTANRMFDGCSSLNTATITHASSAGSNGRISSAQYMFRNCTSLTSASIPIGVLPSATPMSTTNMFNGCSKLTTVTLNIINSGNISTASAMFNGCTRLTTINATGVGSIDASYCTTFSQMFNNCNKLTAIPSIINTKNVKTFSNMFNKCSVLTSIPQYDMTSATALVNYMGSCPQLTNTSLNNVMGSLLTATSYTSTKTLKTVGFTSAQATTAAGLSNWSALSAAGWTTGY